MNIDIKCGKPDNLCPSRNLYYTFNILKRKALININLKSLWPNGYTDINKRNLIYVENQYKKFQFCLSPARKIYVH